MRRSFLTALILLTALACAGRDIPVGPVEPASLVLPLESGSVRFAVIGDSGTGGSRQRDIGMRMAEYHAVFPFDFAIMLGDNLYGGEEPEDFRRKFEMPYRELLDAGVRFYAALGNHDMPDQRHYELFNMEGRRYYSWTRKNVEFFALDSDYLDPDQVDWLEEELAGSDREWKIVFFHHPIYSSAGRHGSNLAYRAVLEPIFVRHGVGAVFQGHDHVYERVHPQQDIYYFVSGAAGKLRHGDVQPSPITARAFDTDLHFMLVEIAGDKLHFQTISRLGQLVDAATLPLLSEERPSPPREDSAARPAPALR